MNDWLVGISNVPTFFKSFHSFNELFFEPDGITAMMLFLRRTLVRFVRYTT